MITRHFVRLGYGSIGSSSPRRSRHSTLWTRQSACAIRTICHGASSTSSRHTAHQSIHSNPHPNQSHDPFIAIHNFIIHSLLGVDVHARPLARRPARRRARSRLLRRILPHRPPEHAHHTRTPPALIRCGRYVRYTPSIQTRAGPAQR